MLPTNSVEYLTYKFKQGMARTPKELRMEIFDKLVDAGQSAKPEKILEELQKMGLDEETIIKVMRSQNS